MSTDNGPPDNDDEVDGRIDSAQARAEYARKFEALDVDPDLFIHVPAGEKESHDHTTYAADDPALDGANYGIYATPESAVVVIDVDDYDEIDDKSGLTALTRLPLTVEQHTPHGGTHYVFVARTPDGDDRTVADVFKDEFNTKKGNLKASFGEIRVANQYVVGAGSQLDGCDKEWCEACETADGGHYTFNAESADRAVAEVSTDLLVEVLRADPKLADRGREDVEGADGDYAPADVEITTSPSDVALDDEALLAKAKAAENGEKFTALWEGRWSEYGYDSQSEADEALLCLLLFWTGGDDQQTARLFRRSALGQRPKADRDDYLETSIESARKYVSTYYDPTKGAGLGGEDGSNGANRDVTHEPPRDLADDPALAGLDSDGRTGGGGSNDPDPDGDGGDADDADSWTGIQRAFADNNVDHGRPLRFSAVKALRDLPMVTGRTTGKMYAYNAERGVFEEGGEMRLKEELVANLGYEYRTARESEIKSQVQGFTAKPEREIGGPDGYLCVGNGVLDLRALEVGEVDPRDPDVTIEDVHAAVDLLDHDPDFEFLRGTPTEYDPDAECPEFRQAVEDVIPDDDHRAKFQEFIGFALLTWDHTFKRAALLLGPKDSGKSTLLNAVEAMLGPENTASENLNSLVNTRWGVAQTYGKMANITNELETNKLQTLGTWKTLTGNDGTITAEFKGEPKFQFEPKAKHIFATNQVPPAADADDAFHERWLHILFPREVPPAKRDPTLGARIEANELPGILNYALEGFARLCAQGGFTGDLPVGAKREQWNAYGNVVQRFAHNCLDVTGDPNEAVARKVAHALLGRFADYAGLPEETQTKLTQELNRQDEILAGRKKRKVHGSSDRYHVYGGVRFDPEALTLLSFDPREEMAKLEADGTVTDDADGTGRTGLSDF